MTTNNPGSLYPDLDQLRALAEAATPGPWHATELTISPVDESEPYICAEVQRDADEAYLVAANPATVLALIARIRDLEAQLNSQTFALNPEPQWIACSGRMPENPVSRPVLIATPGDGVRRAMLNCYGRWVAGYNLNWNQPEIQYWMPLPAPPEQPKGGE